MSNNLTQSSANFSPSSDQFLNNFYKPGFTVSGDQNEYVIAYFETMTGNRDSAIILASSIIYTSVAQGVDPSTIVDQLKLMSDEDQTKFITMFLNFNRVGTSQLGIRNPNKFRNNIQRLINPPPSSFADGSSPERAARNARSIKELTGAQANDYYWIRGLDNRPMHVYCDMTGQEAGSTVGGWMRFDNALVHRYRLTAIGEIAREYIYNSSYNGGYNAVNTTDGTLRGIVWDLGPSIRFSGVRIQRVKFNCVAGQDGYYSFDAPQPAWGDGKPTDEMVVSFIQTTYSLGANFTTYGWSIGNGFAGASNLVRLYKKADPAEWPAQFSGLVTLSQSAFYQYDSTDLDTGRFIYYYESDDASEFNNIIDYTIWLR